MIVVYDKDGRQYFHHHPVDAKEAIATGRFFARSPKLPAPGEPPVETQPPQLGEDIGGLEAEKGPEPEFETQPGKNDFVPPEPEFETTETKKKKRS